MAAPRMIAVYKEPELTPVAFDEAVKIVKAGLSSLTGRMPETRVLALVLAKITLESGRRGTTLLTSCYDGNCGNIKAGLDYDGMFTLYACNEVEANGKVDWYAPAGKLDKRGGVVVSEPYALPPAGDGHPQCRFRAYANEVDGIYEYLDFIWSDRYKDAKAALLTGDPFAYVHALKLLHYFTADETAYARSVASIHAEFVARIEMRPAPVIDPVDITGLTFAQAWNRTIVDAALAAEEAQAGTNEA